MDDVLKQVYSSEAFTEGSAPDLPKHNNGLESEDDGLKEKAEGSADWKTKYELVDQQLKDFRKQAGKVRELLSKKVSYY